MRAPGPSSQAGVVIDVLDIVQVLQGKDRQAAAIERMHLGLGYEYDPHVVDALVDALRRRAPQVPAPQR